MTKRCGPRQLIVLVLLCVVVLVQPKASRGLNAQTFVNDEYAKIDFDHASRSATLSVLNYNRPLLEGLRAVRSHYGWKVDLEEPPHPTVPRGGQFVSTYPESTDIYATLSSSRAAVLNKIVSDYNQAGFPGRYSVVPQPDGSFVVTGTAIQDSDGTYQPVTPILDTKISIPAEPRSHGQTLALIMKTLSETSGLKVSLGAMPTMWLSGVAEAIGGNNVAARTLIRQTIGPDMVWSLYFDPKLKWYMLNVSWVERDMKSWGRRTTVP